MWMTNGGRCCARWLAQARLPPIYGGNNHVDDAAVYMGQRVPCHLPGILAFPANKT
jgi:hypothetical protein